MKLSGHQVLDFLEKTAMQIQSIQKPITEQVTSIPTAVIIKGNPAYLAGNKSAHKFYTQLAKHVRDQGYSVSFDPGDERTMPAKADLWIGHSRGADRLQYAPKGVKTIALGANGGINHPLDKAMEYGQVPNVFHYVLTKEMLSAIDKAKK
jgi:hypothetical protein